MIYTNSTTNYTNIDTQKSVHFAVSRTETRLKMHQTCIWNTGHMQSIAGPVHASAVWTDEKKKKKIITLTVHCLQITGQSRLLGPDSSVLLWVISAQTESVH